LVDVVGRQALDPEQMPVREPGLGGASVHEPGTIGGAVVPGKCDWTSTTPGTYLRRNRVGLVRYVPELHPG
jgi:hypothetical protein